MVAGGEGTHPLVRRGNQTSPAIALGPIVGGLLLGSAGFASTFPTGAGVLLLAHATAAAPTSAGIQTASHAMDRSTEVPEG